MKEKKIRVVYVDDMLIERVKFENTIKNFSNTILEASFSNAKEALDYCSEKLPDLVIVDIEMGEFSGIWLANQLKQLDIPFAFLTSHENHAIDAFKLNALHYLKKPISKIELAEVITRLAANKQDEASFKKELSDNSEGQEPQRIFVNTQKQVIVIQLSDVVYATAEGSYTHFYLANGTKIVSGKTMKMYTDVILKNSDFVRIHRSYIINLNHLFSVVKKKLAVTFVFRNDMQITVAAFRKEGWL